MNPVTLNVLLAGLVSRAGGLLEELRGVTDMDTTKPGALAHMVSKAQLDELKPNTPDHNCESPEPATCGNCGRSWCFRCDPCPSAACHWCHGRGYSTAPLPEGKWPCQQPGHFDGELCNSPLCKTGEPIEEQPTPAALLHRIRDIWDLLDQDNPEIDKPLSAADFIEEIGPIMEKVRPSS